MIPGPRQQARMESRVQQWPRSAAGVVGRMSHVHIEDRGQRRRTQKATTSVRFTCTGDRRPQTCLASRLSLLAFCAACSLFDSSLALVSTVPKIEHLGPRAVDQMEDLLQLLASCRPDVLPPSTRAGLLQNARDLLVGDPDAWPVVVQQLLGT